MGRVRNIIKFINVIVRHPFFMIPDDIYLKIKYRHKTGKKLNLDNPVLFDEKIQWLKLYDRHPDYPNQVDKYEVRKYIARTVGEEYLIPNYGVWDSFDEIPFDKLPDEFVLKCTHDCASVYLCKDKKTLDTAQLRKHFNKCLARNYFWNRREWVYKNIKPRIIAEKFMVDESGTELKDYKIYCFNGEPKIIEVIFNFFTDEPKENFYSPQWEYQPLRTEDYATAPHIKIEKPQCLDRMLDLAKKLSAGKIHVRVDFYIINNRIYFGELTFYNAGGHTRFSPPEWNKIFGDWMALPKR